MFQQIKKRDGRTVKFDPDKITKAIASAGSATGEFDDQVAKRLTIQVLNLAQQALNHKVPVVEEIQDVVEQILLTSPYQKTAKAYIIYREQHTRLRETKDKMSVDLVDQYLSRRDWQVKENSNMAFSLQGLNNYLANEVSKTYWLRKVYPPEIREAYERGDFHIHDLGILAVYTYYGQEVVVAKIKGSIKLISFEKLYSLIEKQERLINEEERVYAKYPKNVYVLDKNGWTEVKRLTRKIKNREMSFVKNRGGRSVIVTDNHPMITEKGEKTAENVTKEDKLFTVDLNKLLKKEKLFSLQEIDLLKEVREGSWKGFKVYFNGLPLKEVSKKENKEGILQTATFSIPRKIKLTEKFGYFVGFTLAEGYLSYDVKSSRNISLAQKDKGFLLKANEGLLENGISGRLIKRKNGYALEIKNPFLKFLFQEVFKIKTGSKNKTLPVDSLLYNKEFVKGMLGGLIDGDGSIETSGATISLRISARAMLEQCSVLLSLLGFTPRDRSLEGEGTIRSYKGRKIKQNYPLYGISFRKTKEELPSEKYKKANLSRKAWQDETKDSWHIVLDNKKANIPDDFIYDITTASSTLVVNGMWNHNCVGWDLQDLLLQGFKGVAGKTESVPAKHLRTALGQIVNFFYTLQGEAAGAQAFSNFDTLLAPFIRVDHLSYDQVKQALQEFIFNMNVPTRVGFQTPYTNITLDLNPSPVYKDQPVIIGGELQKETYGEFQEEMNVFNKALLEVMLEGDAKGRVFTFPIPTYNIDPEFDWENKAIDYLWEATAKYGLPYFANFVNADMKPEDVRSMCCRLRLDLRQLERRGGGYFGANPLTGSVGVVTINLPRLAYLAKDKEDFYQRLDKLMILAKNSLEIKRKLLERLTDKDLYPYSKFYLRATKERFNAFWKNHFSTIGLIGMNEATLNLLGKNLGEPESREFTLEVLDFMRDKLVKFQEETGNNYNLEATPAEGTAYRLALKDKKEFPDIICANEKEYQKGAEPFYTNSSQLPINYTDDVFEALDLQDEIQQKYTGGTVLHLFAGERVKDKEVIKKLVRKVCQKYHLPYFTFTPTFSICPSHGYLPGNQPVCPKCGAKTEVYSRSVGYLRPVSQWNEGKAEEFKERKTFKVEE